MSGRKEKLKREISIVARRAQKRFEQDIKATLEKREADALESRQFKRKALAWIGLAAALAVIVGSVAGAFFL